MQSNLIPTQSPVMLHAFDFSAVLDVQRVEHARVDQQRSTHAVGLTHSAFTSYALHRGNGSILHGCTRLTPDQLDICFVWGQGLVVIRNDFLKSFIRGMGTISLGSINCLLTLLPRGFLIARSAQQAIGVDGPPHTNILTSSCGLGSPRPHTKVFLHHRFIF